MDLIQSEVREDLDTESRSKQTTGYNVVSRVLTAPEKVKQASRLIRNFHNVLRSYVKFDTLTLLAGVDLNPTKVARMI